MNTKYTRKWPEEEDHLHCTSTDPDHPVKPIAEGQTGPAECILGAKMNKETWQCECEEPADETKEAHFELERGEKFCRHICKRSGPVPYVEVFGDRKSDCIIRGKERLVKRSALGDKPCIPQLKGYESGCPEDTRGPVCAYECKPNPSACSEKENAQGFFCLLEEYEEYLTR
jgi:hypothetical protein